MKEAKGFKDSEEPSGGKKVALRLRRLLKNKCVGVKCASLFVSHQGHRSFPYQVLPPTHFL